MPDRVKRLLEERGLHLQHLVLKTVDHIPSKNRPMFPESRRHWYTLDDALRNPWWELDSDFTLPPVSPTMQLSDTDERISRIQPGSRQKRVFMCAEDPYDDAELRYCRSDLEGLEPFDLARTYEWWDIAKQGALIASQRFYQWWIAHDLVAQWVPVRIDEDL